MTLHAPFRAIPFGLLALLAGVAAIAHGLSSGPWPVAAGGLAIVAVGAWRLRRWHRRRLR